MRTPTWVSSTWIYKISLVSMKPDIGSRFQICLGGTDKNPSLQKPYLPGKLGNKYISLAKQ